MRDGGHARNVEHIQSWITQRFGEEYLRVWANIVAPGVQIAWIDEGRLDAETFHGVAQQILRAAIERARGEHMRTSAGKGRKTKMQRCLPAGHGQSGDAAFERRNAFFQYRIGGI